MQASWGRVCILGATTACLKNLLGDNRFSAAQESGHPQGYRPAGVNNHPRSPSPYLVFPLHHSSHLPPRTHVISSRYLRGLKVIRRNLAVGP
jgi:hypothetical protein